MVMWRSGKDELREPEGASRRGRRIVAAVSVAALASLGLMVGGAGSAQAASGSGWTGWSNTGVTLDRLGTYWFKGSNTGFSDFNLKVVPVSDSYSGWYWQSGTYWKHGSKGYVYKAKSNTGYTVLLTSINVGSYSTVDAASSSNGVVVTVVF
jgi:hypothetical protein